MVVSRNTDTRTEDGRADSTPVSFLFTSQFLIDAASHIRDNEASYGFANFFTTAFRRPLLSSALFLFEVTFPHHSRSRFLVLTSVVQQ